MRQIDPLQSFDSIYICLTRAATLFTGSRRKDHKANLLSEIHNLICKQITLAHTRLLAAHATAELPQYNHKMRDTWNNKMSIFSHKDVFVRGMKDAQAYCFWPRLSPVWTSVKLRLLYSSPAPSAIWKQVAGVSSWHRSISSPALPYQRWLVEIRWWGRLQGFHDGWRRNWP